jgi:four helix bundle protein
LGHARGSLFEVETQILLAEDLKYIDAEQARNVLDKASEVARIVNGLIASLN